MGMEDRIVLRQERSPRDSRHLMAYVNSDESSSSMARISEPASRRSSVKGQVSMNGRSRSPGTTSQCSLPRSAPPQILTSSTRSGHGYRGSRPMNWRSSSGRVASHSASGTG